ncbi:flagellar basal-body MS-ring/collar protein FliF [Thiomicrospira microaerophila]|uniref:flagellar basal-body MS-ring/collar protein FliF n=1 Tax=Thiomicrospira microaerophila TaxID=406020 RepID=UPI0005CA0F6D|nr:flagellar basal-body MS-ring/collar protein FliF [Thiomicrospira microaerophila]
MAESASLNNKLNTRSNASIVSTLVENLTSLPVARQIGIIIGLSASVALAIGILLWSQSTQYTLLFGSMETADMNEVARLLDAQRVDYKLDMNSGSVMVPSDRVHALRLQLASEGYPKQAETGYQLLDREQGFGISQFRETTQYHRALEGELAKSVSSLNQVESARVMLGLPKRSVFVRKQEAPTASVVIKLRSGRTLDDQAVAAIVHLVAASIPNLNPRDVTVVDQLGNLLSNNNQTAQLQMNMRQLEYTRTVEETLTSRVVSLIAPVVGGAGKVRAQVTAEIDFTQQEQTRELFEPDPSAVRSEQEIRELNRNQGPIGIPGALTNQPPRAGLAPEEGYTGAQDDPNLKSMSERRTRNFEIDRTISHIKGSVGNIRRLSVAVVLDDKMSLVEGVLQRQALSEEELLSFRRLIIDTVGLDEARGDTLTLINASFVEPDEDFFEATPFWQEPWFWDIMKQVLAALAILIIFFAVVKPMLRDLTKKEEAYLEYPDDVEEDEDELRDGDEISKALDKMNEELQAQVSEEAQGSANSEEAELFEKVKALVQSDPKLASMIIKQWMQEGDDG